MQYFKIHSLCIKIFFIILFLIIFRNGYTQTFGNRQVISTNCEDARFVTACDLDNDGDMDVISASGDDDKIAWYENPGDGNFGDQQVITTSVNHPMTIHLDDLDGDGDLDLLTGSHVTFQNTPILNKPGKLVWIENQDQGAFSDPKTIADSVYYPKTLCIADLDGDGDKDALCGSQKAITWYVNDGSGGFGDENEILSPMNNAGVMQAADMDGDGVADVVYAYPLPDHKNLYWFQNEGDGSFIYYHSVACANLAPDAIYVTDLDGDSDPDILGVNDYYDEADQLVWFRNQDGSGTQWNLTVMSTALDNPQSVYAADLDGDGDNDVLTASREDDKIAWYENDGYGSFSDQQIITTEADAANSVFAADLDGDGDKDVLSASGRDNTIAWYENMINSIDVHPYSEEKSNPGSFELAQNYPNPFNMQTEIIYELPEADHVIIKIYNSLGHDIRTLISRNQEAGRYAVRWDGMDNRETDVTSGIYIYSLKTNRFSDNKKMLLIK